MAGETCDVVLVSVQLGHKHPRSSLVYVHPQGGEAEFVADVIGGMSTADLCDKWLGGRAGALDLLRSAFDNATQPQTSEA